MTFFSVLIALILEQRRALSPRYSITALLHYHMAFVQRFFADTIQPKQNVLAWLSITVPWVLIVFLVYFALYRLHFLLAFIWNIVIVYLTLGFRQFSHYFSDIHRAVRQGELDHARTILREWTHLDTIEMPASELIRHTLVRAVIDSHRHVFGVFFWFLMPIGPAGAILYRVAEYLTRTENHSLQFSSSFVSRAFYLIDWLPARLTALGFAIVGNFEEALGAWRTNIQPWSALNNDVLMAAGGGALGVALVTPKPEIEEDVLVDDVMMDESYHTRLLQSAVGLVWRAVILWMCLLFMLTMAVWIG